MIPAFSFSLNHPILPGLVTVGKFNGEHPSLACATTADSVIIHNAHDRSAILLWFSVAFARRETID